MLIKIEKHLWKKVITGLLYLALYFYPSILLQAQINTYTDADRSRMLREADKLVEDYKNNLNSIASATNKQFQNDDINKTLSSFFESSNSPVYDDLSRSNQEKKTVTVRDYLEGIPKYYPGGVKFEYSTNLKNPCYQRINDQNFYVVKAEVFKKLEGILGTDNAMNINRDSIDIYMKFPILQNRPTLKTGLPIIFQIVNHQETICEESVGDVRPPLADYEQEYIKKRAETFVEDYENTLNIIGNKNINERYNTLDYFDSNATPVYNDIAVQFLLNSFIADAYLKYIEQWYQEGIEFKYRTIKATNILLEDTYVSVEVEVDRVIKVPVKDYRDHQEIKIFVKFPFLEDGRVGLERVTPRIYRIEEKARKTEDRNYLAVGLQLNASNYYGDLNPANARFNTDIGLTRVGFGIHAVKKINSFTYLRGSITTGRIVGDDNTSANPNDDLARYRYIRNLHFRNRIWEFSVMAVFDIIPNQGLYYRRRKITPYAFVGIGVALHSPEARGPGVLSNTWVPLRDLGTEGQGQPGYAKKYSLMQPVIPMGLGVKVRLDYRWDLSMEVGMRYTFTDYLDDVSGLFPDPGDLPNGVYEFTNRTLEPNSVFSGDSRQEQINRLSSNLQLGLITFIGTDGLPYQTFNGYGRKGDQRGGSKVDDFYVFTGFHLNYLLNVGRPKAPLQKTPTYQYDF